MSLKLSEQQIIDYLSSIPIGKENAISYAELCFRWKANERKAREIMHELGLYDSGDELILIRSSSGKGFYRTDDREDIKAYKKECLNKGKSCFAPVKKINRILKDDASADEIAIFNNLKSVRLSKGFKQREVINIIKDKTPDVDESMLSKFENGVCIPTPKQLLTLASVYKCSPSELLSIADDNGFVSYGSF